MIKTKNLNHNLLANPVESIGNITFLNSTKTYSTLIYRNLKHAKTIDNFYSKNVEEFNGILILSGFYIDNENFYRVGSVIYLSKNLEVISERRYSKAFSEICWSDGIISCGNSYKPQEDVMNGDIFVNKDFSKIKLPTMLTGEFEFRGGTKLKNEYLFYGVDKDNFRGILVRLTNNLTEFIEIEINNDLWEFSGITTFNDLVVLSGNKWEKVGFRGFILIFKNDNTYKLYDIPIESSWFEILGIREKNGNILISVFDFDSNEGILMRAQISNQNVEFEILEKNFRSQYFISKTKIFTKKL